MIILGRKGGGGGLGRGAAESGSEDLPIEKKPVSIEWYRSVYYSIRAHPEDSWRVMEGL